MKDIERSFNEIPHGWAWVSIKEIAELISGQHILKDNYNLGAIGIPYLTGPDDFGSKYPSISKWTTMPKAIAMQNDLLITVKGAGVGKVNILNIDEAVISRQLMAIRSEYVDSNYLFFFAQANFGYFQKLGAGSTVPGIDRESILNVSLPIAPFAEQHRIIAKIEELFSRLDAGVEALHKAQAQLKRYRQAVLKAAVEGRLTEEWRKEHPEVEPAEELRDRILSLKKGKLGKKFKEPNELDTVGLPVLPESWLWVRLDSLAALKGGITKDAKRKVNEGRTVPYLRVANVQRGYLDLDEIKEIEASDEIISELRLERGDILFNEGGDRDKLGRGWIWQGELPECIHQNHVFRARLYSNDVSNKFVSWFGNTYGQRYFLKEGKQTTNLASVNLTKLSAFPVPLPPKEEQEVIIEEIERLISISDESKKVINQNLSRTNRLRQTILKRAFEGKLVPQDISDEPASVLLERIKSERDKTRPKLRSHLRETHRQDIMQDKMQDKKLEVNHALPH
jgi:type I restriction enzyme S subunit